jgi:O-antigen/teichoic acid export membrane protein
MRRIALDVTSSGASHVIGAACQLLTQVVAVRSLELEDYGTYVASIAIVALFEITILSRGYDVALHAFSEAWHLGDSSVLRRCYSTLVRQDARWTFVGYLLVLCVVWPVERFLNVSALMFAVAALAIPCQQGYGATKAFLILKSKVRESALFEIVFVLGAAAISIAAVLLFGAWGLVGAYVLAAALKSIAARVWVSSMLPQAEPAPSDAPPGVELAITQPSLGQSARAIMRNLMNALAEQVDVVILNSFAGPAAVAIYRVAKSLGSLPSRVLAPVWVALRPGLVHMWRRDELHPLRMRILKVGGAMLVALMLVLPLVSWLASDIVSMIYGAKAVGIAAPLVLLFAANWVLQGATSWYRHLAPIAEHRTRAVFASVLQLGLTVLLGLWMGRESALDMATAFTIAAVASAIFCWVSALWLPRRGGQ